LKDLTSEFIKKVSREILLLKEISTNLFKVSLLYLLTITITVLDCQEFILH